MTGTTPPAPRTLDLADEAASMQLGRDLARGLLTTLQDGPAGLVVYLSGNLGAGKTTVVRALLRALGVTGRIKSPTFTLLEPYALAEADLAQVLANLGIEFKRNLSIYCYHFDFYRFTDPREFFEAGFREHFHDDSICLIEWPERIRSDFAPGTSAALPDPDLVVRLDVPGPGQAGRRARLEAHSARGAQCLAAVAS